MVNAIVIHCPVCSCTWHHMVYCSCTCRAPDGTCLLVSSADCKLRLFNLPTELYSGPVEQQLPEMVSCQLSVSSEPVE